MRTIGETGRRTFGRLAFLNGLGLAVALIFSAPAAAGPPVNGMIAAGMIGQASIRNDQGPPGLGGCLCRRQSRSTSRRERRPRTPTSVPRISRSSHVRSWLTPRPRAWPTVSSTSSDPRVQIRRPCKALIAKNPKVELDQLGCEFMPYAVAIHQDQIVVFKSSDPRGHNIRYNSFANGGGNEMLAPKGQLEKKLMADRYPIELKCDIHPWMKGYLMVFDHPFFTITGPDGSFEIKGVPPGTQNLVVRQETVGWITPGKGTGMPVTVKAGEVTDVGEIKIVPKP